jgi:hypothetical protein
MLGRNAAGTVDLECRHGHAGQADRQGEQPSVTRRAIVKIPLLKWQEDCPNPGEAQRHAVSHDHRTRSRLFFVFVFVFLMRGYLLVLTLMMMGCHAWRWLGLAPHLGPSESESALRCKCVHGTA